MPKPPPNRLSELVGNTDLLQSPNEEEAAQYIAALTRELSAIARTSRLDLLAYLLEMVYLEAMSIVGSSGGQSTRQ